MLSVNNNVFGHAWSPITNGTLGMTAPPTRIPPGCSVYEYKVTLLI